MVTSLQELKTALDGLNIPVAYSHFKDNTYPPYCVFFVDSQDGFYADNVTYTKSKTINIELYTDMKNETLEASLEQILNDNEIPFEVITEVFIEDENMYEVVYEIEI